MNKKDNFTDMVDIAEDIVNQESTGSDKWEVVDNDGDIVELGY